MSISFMINTGKNLFILIVAISTNICLTNVGNSQEIPIEVLPEPNTQFSNLILTKPKKTDPLEYEFVAPEVENTNLEEVNANDSENLSEPENNNSSETTEETANSGVEQEELGGKLRISVSKNFGLGTFIGEPTALQGSARTNTVLRGSRTASKLPAAGYFRQPLTAQDNLLLVLTGDMWVFDPQGFGFDASYFHNYTSLPGRFTVNVSNLQTAYPAFAGGNNEVNLPNGDNAVYNSLGGGIEHFQIFSQDFSGAVGLNYRKVSIRDGLFSSNLEPVDELGNPLTVTDQGQDDLFTLNFSGLYSHVDNAKYPTTGTRIRFGMDQAFPVGEASILYNRLSANFVQYIPVNFFGFTEGPRTLILNFQGGTMLGDVPPYEGFTLGGGDSVRGYSTGDVGTGRSFIQATAEYRFPISSFNAFNNRFDLAGSLFIDYASNLGTQDNVMGKPGEVRDKQGDGLGYGLGLLTKTPIGFFRFEFGFNDQGGSAFQFTIGDRF